MIIIKNQGTLITDKNDSTNFRVESIDDDGACEVAIFSGSNALDRAIIFAGGDYYESWCDPEGLSEPSREPIA